MSCFQRNTMKVSMLGRTCMVSSLRRKENAHPTRFVRLTRFCDPVSSRNFIRGGGKDNADGRGSCELLGASQVVISTGKGIVCPYIRGKTSARRLSRGVGSADDVEGRNELKTSACDVAYSTPIIGPKDLSDLNTEITSYVGSLGDPDFDIEEDLSSAMLKPGAPPLVPTTSSNIRSVEVEASKVNITRNESAFRTNHCTGDQKRLTLADDPSCGRYRTSGSKFGNTNAGCEQITAFNDFGSFETLGSISTSGGTSGFMGGPKPERDNDESKGTVNVERGETPKKKLGKIGSVMVLNGAACFIQGRLASTGESAAEIIAAIETSAQEFGLAVSIYNSNREADLLDRLCEDRYNAIVYNAAGFGSHIVGVREDGDGTPECETTYSSSSAGNGTCVKPSALDYALARTGCPVVKVFPQGDITLSAGRMDRDLPIQRWRTRKQQLGVISGFSGAVSYRLALASIQLCLTSVQ